MIERPATKYKAPSGSRMPPIAGRATGGTNTIPAPAATKSGARPAGSRSCSYRASSAEEEGRAQDRPGSTEEEERERGPPGSPGESRETGREDRRAGRQRAAQPGL